MVAPLAIVRLLMPGASWIHGFLFAFTVGGWRKVARFPIAKMRFESDHDTPSIAATGAASKSSRKGAFSERCHPEPPQEGEGPSSWNRAFPLS
jgi:hypothetical protein